MESTLSWEIPNPLQIHRCFLYSHFWFCVYPSGLEGIHTPSVSTLPTDFVSIYWLMSFYESVFCLWDSASRYWLIFTHTDCGKLTEKKGHSNSSCSLDVQPFAYTLKAELRVADAVSVGHERNRGLKEDAKVLGLSNMKKRTFIYTGEEDRGRTDLGGAIKQAVSKPSWIPNLFLK